MNQRNSPLFYPPLDVPLTRSRERHPMLRVFAIGFCIGLVFEAGFGAGAEHYPGGVGLLIAILAAIWPIYREANR